ncbi:hypothetical protein FRC08_003923 [Ceratobasidium sp. 394]|nr:hypothetical protein FRC08_003923 [Ceratobasidium sp. 394]
MFSESKKVHPSIQSKGLRMNKGKREEQYPLTPKTRDSERPRSKKPPAPTRDAFSEFSQEVSATNARLVPSTDRIHLGISPNRGTEKSSAYNSASTRQPSTSGGKENITFVSPPSAMPALGPVIPSSYASNQQAVPRSRKRTNPTILQVSNVPVSRGPMKVVFSESLVAVPTRTATPLRAPSLHRAKRRTELPPQSDSSTRALSGKLRARFEETTARYPQGHRIAPRSRTKSPAASRPQPEVATAKALEKHVRETAAEVSNLNSHVSSLNTTMAAVLPIVAEARLLWMENTVIRAQTKLGTTRQAFCQYCESVHSTAVLTCLKPRSRVCR